MISYQIRSKPRAVQLLAGDDFRCALMGSLGFSTRHIIEHTGLTPSQVCYRLRLGGIKRSDYRNGNSAVASSMLRKARVIAVPVVEDHLREFIAASATAGPSEQKRLALGGRARGFRNQPKI